YNRISKNASALSSLRARIYPADSVELSAYVIASTYLGVRLAHGRSDRGSDQEDSYRFVRQDPFGPRERWVTDDGCFRRWRGLNQPRRISTRHVLRTSEEHKPVRAHGTGQVAHIND